MSSLSLPVPSLLLLVLHVSLSPVFAQVDNEISHEDDRAYKASIEKDESPLLKKLQTETEGLSISQSFRCGIFIVNPKHDNGLPVTSLKVFPALFEATEECEAGKPNVKRYNKFCSDIMKKIGEKTKITLKMPSTFKKQREQGKAIGDDICWKIKRDVRAPFVGGRRSKRFPEGLQFGLYSNACNESLWHFTGVKHEETICCGRGNMIDCPF